MLEKGVDFRVIDILGRDNFKSVICPIKLSFFELNL